MGNSGGSIVTNDFTAKGILRSIGDPGATPTDQVGQTVLKRLYVLDANIDTLQNIVRSLNGDQATRVVKSSNAVNSIGIAHTVTAGKNLYLTGYWAAGYGTTGPNYAIMGVRNGADAFQYWLAHLENAAASLNYNQIVLPCPSPIVIPEGWDIYFESPNITSLIYGGFFGWEE